MVMRVHWINESVSMRNTGFPVLTEMEVFEDYISKDFGHECEQVVENSDKDLIGYVNSRSDLVRWVYGLAYGGVG